MVSRTVGQVDLRVKTRLSDEGDSCTRLEVGNPDLEVVFVAQQVESSKVRRTEVEAGDDDLRHSRPSGAELLCEAFGESPCPIARDVGNCRSILDRVRTGGIDQRLQHGPGCRQTLMDQVAALTFRVAAKMVASSLVSRSDGALRQLMIAGFAGAVRH
ncbi:MAG TPA: hypothetical protein DCQ52_15230 [Acidimicrobiaceae bacterium]|nr:hypothetical protein [Acidimicrobiaceae bacterium]